MPKITPSLRLIYTWEDDRLVVVDMTSPAMLDRFAAMKSGRGRSASKNAKRVDSKKKRQT